MYEYINIIIVLFMEIISIIHISILKSCNKGAVICININ